MRTMREEGEGHLGIPEKAKLLVNDLMRKGRSIGQCKTGR